MMRAGRTAPVPVAQFGKDHWSLFGYIETRIVDCRGAVDARHMRTDPDLHPGLAVNGDGANYTQKYPTKLARSEELADHDDWDCADDLVEAGLLDDTGTGINRRYALTPLGKKVASALRYHKGRGGSFATFVDVSMVEAALATG